jgi:peptidoglycan/xylan/chitin deacetylase (PgdA/CDA1 family)
MNRILTQHHNGAIVLMHCNGPATLVALPEVIRTLKELGYEFVTVAQL